SQPGPRRQKDERRDVRTLRISMELPQHLARAPFYFELDAKLAIRQIEIDTAVFGTKLVFPQKLDAMMVQYLFNPTLKAVFRPNGVPIGLQQLDKFGNREFRHTPTLPESTDSMGLWAVSKPLRG